MPGLDIMSSILRLLILFSLILLSHVSSFPNEKHIDDLQHLKKEIATSNDLFTSMDHMQLLIHSHEEITNFIKEVIEYQKKQMHLANLY